MTMSGFSFGNPSTPTAGGFGFGSNTNTTPAATGFGGFNAAPATSSAATTGFSFGGATTSTANGLAFGTTTTTQTGFGFGTTPAAGTSTGFGGFGTTNTAAPGGFNFANKVAATTTTAGFSFGGPNTTGGLFTAPKTTVSSNFGFGGIKGFGQPTNLQGQPPQQIQGIQQQLSDPNVALYMAVCAPAYFNDERDEVLKKWNQLQAAWGVGKGFYAQNTLPVEFTADNPFCRFKAVGYIKMPSFSSEDGFVELQINKTEQEVKIHQQQIIDTLVKMFNGCQVCVDYVRSIGTDKTRMCIFIQQRNQNGETKKASSWDVYNHMANANNKQILQNLCIENVAPLVSLSETQLKEYLDQPPRGIDPMIWEQGKRGNPDSKKYLPVPMVGFQEVKARFKAQEEESRLLQGQLDLIADDITQLQGKQSTLLDNLHECKRRQIQMAHRVLRLIIKQEVGRKRGVPIEQGEEQLRMLLESLHAQLVTPTQYMGRLNELLSQISVQPGGNCGFGSDQQQFALDSTAEKDFHQFLAWQQDSIKEVVNVVKDDLIKVDTVLAEIKKK